MGYLAIVDLGSNSTRFVIEKLQADGTFQELERVKKDTRLAEGMGKNEGYLTETAMQRVFEAVSEFKEIAQSYQDLEVIGIATAAVREAKNKTAFVQQLSDKFKIDVRVLTGDQEAYYDYLGAMSALDHIDNAWLLDTGGASIELVGIEDRMAVNFISLPFGAVNLAERFNLNGPDPITDESLSEAEQYIDREYDELPWLECDQQPIILLGGANRTLARLHRSKQAYEDLSNFHGYQMPVEHVQALFDELRSLSHQERSAILGAEANRADIIISGLLPLMQLVDVTGTKEVIFSASGVREGILQEYRLEQNDN
ncbi:Ppx/GppA family phosphatase [Weissella koreensis]|uniref:Ppx/GppA phosphatase family protein n=1 Tax=Weissella koreensis TaxID=165096 RepID=UPI0012B4CE41|nr:Ppx/GppA family phosphatase [Weissella koreensis]QGN20208.1 exopolyphosphatase [Weissella koreensis]